ncbi:MAG: sugar ABC transporter substrate-binding protein [Clostridia bacterium]
MKKALSILLVLLLSLSIVGAASSEALTGKLTIWSWDIAYAQLQRCATRFQAIHPGVEFVFEEMGTDQIYDKLTACLATGVGLPDVVSLEGEQFPKYGANFPDAFVDFTDMLDSTKFLPIKLAEATVNGRVLAYPWDAAPVALFYRTDVFEQAGIQAADLKTWDDLLEAGKIIKEKTGYSMLPMATSRNDIIYRIILMQLGSWYFDEAGNTRIDSPESLKAMSMVKKLYDAGITQSHGNWDEYVATISQNKVACFAEAIWMAGTIKVDAADAAGSWRVMDLPMLDETSTGAACNGGSLLAVPASSQSLEAAKAFVEYAMTDPVEQEDGINNGFYPSYIPSYDIPAFQQEDPFFGGQNINSVFAAIGQKIPFVNYTQNFGETADTMKNAVAQILLDGKDVGETLASTQAELVAKFGK